MSTAFVSTSPRRLRASRTAVSTHFRFLDAIGQDPVLSQVKLIAEPWDVGPDGYHSELPPTGGMERPLS